MLIERKLKVSAVELFDYVENLFYRELKKSGFNEVNKENIVEGYELSKTLSKGKNEKVNKYIVEKFDRPKRFRIVNEKDGIKHYVDYRIREKHAFLVDVEYEEGIITNDLKMKFKAMADDSKTRKNMAKAIKQIEIDIIYKRNNKENGGLNE